MVVVVVSVFGNNMYSTLAWAGPVQCATPGLVLSLLIAGMHRPLGDSARLAAALPRRSSPLASMRPLWRHRRVSARADRPSRWLSVAAAVPAWLVHAGLSDFARRAARSSTRPPPLERHSAFRASLQLEHHCSTAACAGSPSAVGFRAQARLGCPTSSLWLRRRHAQ